MVGHVATRMHTLRYPTLRQSIPKSTNKEPISLLAFTIQGRYRLGVQKALHNAVTLPELTKCG